MARGWESKAIESQQESAADARRNTSSMGLPAERTAPHQGDPGRRAAYMTLMLARTRALADLQSACAPAHRAMLEQAIAELDQRLAALSTT
jgi:hypothetical protein